MSSSTSARLTVVALAILFAPAACGHASAPVTNPTSAVAASGCPQDGESAEDCPWALVTRELRAEETAGAARIQARLGELLPDLKAAIALVPTIGSGEMRYVDLWGRSSNYDASQLHASAPRPTVDAPILDALNDLAGVADARHGNLGAIRDAITFAGIEHTYGYLFSVLPTPFGFKRARWVRDDIEAGFGLPRGTLGPRPAMGSLFANVTYFAGTIAFRGPSEAREFTAVARGVPAVSPDVRSFGYHSIALVRVEEILTLGGDPMQTVALRTDLVRFTRRTKAADGNSNLLIYSVYDSRESRTRLISVFPVNDQARARALDSSRLGDGVPIATQYNAFVDGITNAAAGARLEGSRHVLRADGSRCDAECAQQVAQ